jgi:hypothetical protein
MPSFLNVFAESKTVEAKIHRRDQPRNLVIRVKRADAKALTLAKPLAVVRIA